MAAAGLTADWVVALSATVTGAFVSWAARNVAETAREFAESVENNEERSTKNRRALRQMGADHLPPASNNQNDG